MLTGKDILITGATGTLGSALAHALLEGRFGPVNRLVLLSRDEAKQQEMARDIATRHGPLRQQQVFFRVGDIRHYETAVKSIRDIDVIVHCAALKQVPTCERFPEEAVATNVLGILNLINSIQNTSAPVETLISISTDKAVEPVNAMGMTKALQEKLIIAANQDNPATRFLCVRYGNVLGSRGSVLPMFLEQASRQQPLTVTHRDMTRFLITLDEAVDAVVHAYRHGQAGHIIVPALQAARILDLAELIAGQAGLPVHESGQRPGEKLHELLLTAEETARSSTEHPGYFHIPPFIAGYAPAPDVARIASGYSSEHHLIDRMTAAAYLYKQGWLAHPPQAAILQQVS